MKTNNTKEEERVRCSVCREFFLRDRNRKNGRLVSCPAHSFGEIELEDYEKLGIDPNTGNKVIS